MNETTGVKRNALFSWSLTGKNSQWHVRFADYLQRVISIFDNNVHMILEHVDGTLHKLHHPSGLFASFIVWLRVVDLLANFDVNKRRHLV